MQIEKMKLKEDRFCNATAHFALYIEDFEEFL